MMKLIKKSSKKAIVREGLYNFNQSQPFFTAQGGFS